MLIMNMCGSEVCFNNLKSLYCCSTSSLWVWSFPVDVNIQAQFSLRFAVRGARFPNKIEIRQARHPNYRVHIGLKVPLYSGLSSGVR